MFDLGAVTVAVDQSAVNYVSVEAPQEPAQTKKPKSTAAPDIRQQDPCPLCGKSNLHGGHICPVCNKPYCKHDQSACLKIANPAKTPIPTKNAEGKSVSHYVTEDGSTVVGWSGKSEVWRPGAFITPSPSPTPRWP